MNKRVRKIEARMLTGIALVVIAMTAFVFAVFIGRTNRLIKKELALMMSANGQQLQLNVDNYFSNVEHSARSMFANEEYVNFDPTDSSLSEYEIGVKKDEISSYINSLSTSVNFCDFGIVYSNDQVSGNISQTTKDRFADGGIYAYFSGLITDRVEGSGWSSSSADELRRLVYVKRLGPHAVIVTSFYTEELSPIFSFSDWLPGGVACLTDRSGRILYSTDEVTRNRMMPGEITAPVKKDASNYTGISSRYLTTVNTLDNGWRVYCYAPVSKLMEVFRRNTHSVGRLTLVLAPIFVAAFVLMAKLITTPINGMVDSLEEKAQNDGLTGLLNKETFEHAAQRVCAGAAGDDLIVFVMLDIDQFKQVNDRYGHARGDEVLRENGRAMKYTLRSAAAIGRTGGDEFAACYCFSSSDRETVIRTVREELGAYRSAFQAAVRESQMEVTTSAGVIVSPAAGRGFTDYYLHADRALYESKRSGRNQVTWFSETDEGVTMSRSAWEETS